MAMTNEDISMLAAGIRASVADLNHKIKEAYECGIIAEIVVCDGGKKPRTTHQIQIFLSAPI